MEKGKNLFIIMLLAVAGVFMFQSFFGNKDKDQEQAAAAAQATSQPAAIAAAPAKDWFVKRGEAKIVTLGSLAPESPYKLEMQITSDGAGIDSVKLDDYFETVADQRLFSRNPSEYAKKAAENPEKYKGHYGVLRAVDYGGHIYRSLETRQINVLPEGQKLPFVFSEVRSKPWTCVDVKLEEKTNTPIAATFEWNLFKANAKGEKETAITVRKTYSVKPDDYSIEVKLEIVSHLAEPVSISVEQAGPVGIPHDDIKTDLRMAVSAKIKDGSIQPINYTIKELNSWPYGQAHFIGGTTEVDATKNAPTPMVWFGLTNKYFDGVLYLQPQSPEHLAAVSYDADYYITPVQAIAPTKEFNGRTWDTSMWIKDIKLAGKDKSETLTFNIFTGPKMYDLFKANPLYAKLHYSETIVSQSCSFMTFSWLMELLVWMLTFFATHLFFGNYGLAIILLVFIVRVILHPLTKKGQVSMMKMQKQMAKLKPELDRIKERCGNDKQKQQQETMKFYKEHGNPMSGMLGCLPMVLQMPIWVALYSALGSAISLRHAAFLPVWITDLAAPDQLFTWSHTLPVIGNSFNLLPVLLTVFMFFQQKYMTPPTSATMTPEQEQQQKMMKIMMPIMMLFIFYTMPSGLNLYIMTSTAVGIVEQIYIRRHIRQQEEREAATETVIDAGGKGPRGNRPKKYKGPFKY